MSEHKHIGLATSDGFETLFRTHYASLVRYAFTLLKDQHEAEDRVQHVFVQLWEKRDAIEVHTSLKAFLYRSVYNACMNNVKRKEIHANYVSSAMMSTAQSDFQDEMNEKEIVQRIEIAINELPEQCRKIFVLSRYEGKKYQEIADELGLSIKTIENQMGKALRLMRDYLKEYLPLVLICLYNLYGR